MALDLCEFQKRVLDWNADRKNKNKDNNKAGYALHMIDVLMREFGGEEEKKISKNNIGRRQTI